MNNDNQLVQDSSNKQKMAKFIQLGILGGAASLGMAHGLSNQLPELAQAVLPQITLVLFGAGLPR